MNAGDQLDRAAADGPALVGRDLHKTFRRETGQLVQALDGVSVEARRGALTALVGPDGAGKTTLLRLATGLLIPAAGELEVLGIDVAAHPQEIQTRLSYMPQQFGLYEDLTVQENLDLYADLHGVTAGQRRERYPELLEMTALAPFVRRLAGRLSGGMKQKLGLACCLVRLPELLLLDEPTAGVDPLSRHELWEIVQRLVKDEGLSVLLATSYLDEAERCEHVVVMHQGRVLAQGPPAETSALANGRTFQVDPPAGHPARELQSRLLDESDVIDAVPDAGRVHYVTRQTGGERVAKSAALAGLSPVPIPPRFEDGFMVLLRGQTSAQPAASAPSPAVQPAGAQEEMPESTSRQRLAAEPSPAPERADRDVVVEVRDVTKKFGAFTAVDHVSFEVQRGEMFGLLGPNGAGKTTTFRMLCGLTPASGGTLRVAGVDLARARASARQRIGYVAQKFSLYGQLTVSENLDFFASAYGLRGRRKRERMVWALRQFDLEALARLPSGQLPGGYQRRLAMAAALMHEPEILFLDEPTSGADPLARREFWRRITALSEQGVTAIVTTHFMEEAAYCDRILILDGGRLLAQGPPAEIRRRGHAPPGREPTMEDAFITILMEARQERAQPAAAGGAA